jgi:hypothetical protein
MSTHRQGKAECHYPVESNKEKDCNPERFLGEGGGCNSNQYPPSRKVEVDREGIDLYVSIRLKPLNIILSILTIGVVLITILLVKRYA